MLVSRWLQNRKTRIPPLALDIVGQGGRAGRLEKTEIWAAHLTRGVAGSEKMRYEALDSASSAE